MNESRDGNIFGIGRSVVALRMYEAREGFELMLFGTLVGALVGLLGVGLNVSVHFLDNWRTGLPRGFFLITLPALGAMTGLLIQRFVFGDYNSNGVPDVIRAVTVGKGILPRGLLASRLISSSLTVGCGGTAGLEGPIVASGAALGSIIARIFQFSQRRRVLLIACGTSAAIASVFNAPLTGMIFSLEIILGEWKARNLVPTVTAAAVAAQVSRVLMGDKVPFPRETILQYTTPDLPAFVILGLVCAVAGWFFVASLERFSQLFQKISLPLPLRAALGGLLVGIIGYYVPAAQGEGYESIRNYIVPDFSEPMAMIGLVLILRYCTTLFTLGSGGAGGSFAPSLYFGSAIGLLFGNILQTFPKALIIFASPAAYSLVGMAGFIAGIMSAPLTGMFFILEMCGSYDLILPLMLAALSSMVLSRFLSEGSIYTKELIQGGNYMRRGSGVQLIADIDISEVISQCPEIEQTETMGDFVDNYGHDQRDVYALLDDDGRYQGLVFLEDVRPYLFEESLYPLITMASIADVTVPTLSDTSTPDQAWIAFGNTERDALPVLDGNGEVVGIVTKNKLFDSARTEIFVHDDD